MGNIPSAYSGGGSTVTVPGMLSNYLARTIEPDTTVNAGYTLGTSNTIYAGLVSFPASTLITSLVIDFTTLGGTPTVNWGVVWSPATSLVAASTANTPIAWGVGLKAWPFTAQETVPAGLYYIGIGMSQPTHTTVLSGIASPQAEVQGQLTGTAPNYYRFIQVTGYTLTSTPPAVGSNILTSYGGGTIASITSGLFFGII